LDGEIAELTARRQRIEADTRAETGTAFAALMDRRKAEYEAAVQGPLAARHSVLADEAKKQDSAVAELRKQLAEATRKPGLFARLFGKAKPSADPAAIQAKLSEAERWAGEMAREASELQKHMEAAAAALAAEHEQLIAEEVAARSLRLDARLEQLTADRQRLATEI